MGHVRIKKGIPHEALDYSCSTGDTYRIKECNQCAGTGNSLAVQVTRKADGFMWHCYRCHITSFYPDTTASPGQVQQIMANTHSEREDTRPEIVYLPSDFTPTIPSGGLVQLYDLGITDEDMQFFDIGWSASHKRIIVPVYKYGKYNGMWSKKLIGFVGRKLDSDDKDSPKWWSVRQREIKHARFMAVPKQDVLYDKQVVFVEDVFSAIKISNAGWISSALLTTYLPYELYGVLKQWEVIIWLDSDAYTKAIKYVGLLGANGIKARAVHSSKDPKHYSYSEITEAILHEKIL